MKTLSFQGALYGATFTNRIYRRLLPCHITRQRKKGYLQKPDGPELAFVGFGLDWRVHCQQDFLLSPFQGNKMSSVIRLYYPTDLAINHANPKKAAVKLNWRQYY